MRPQLSFRSFGLLILSFLCAASAAWAAEGLQAVIKTTGGKTITVTSISPDGRIEFTPQGGKKTKVLFKTIARIEWDKGTREHAITTHDGQTQKVTRAWIFAGNGAYLQFTGTDEAGKDADGTIAGTDIASIVFTMADSPAHAAKTPEPAKADTPVTPPPAEPGKPARSTKRLPTSNLEYARDAATELDKVLPGLVAQFVKAKADGQLAATDADEGLAGLKLQKGIHQAFKNLPRYYFAARKDGWEPGDPECAPLREKILATRQTAAQADFWTCVNPDDELGTTDVTQFEYWDRLRLRAFGAMLWTTAGKDPKQGKELMEKVTGEIAQFEEGWKKNGEAVHPAFLRLTEEVSRLQKECTAGFADAGKAREAALAAWQALRDEAKRLRNITNKIENGQCHPNDWATFIEELATYEKTDSAVVKEKIELLGKTCGTSLENLEASMEKLLDKNPSGWDWSAEVKHFDKILQAIPPLRKSIGEDIAGRADQDLKGMGSFDEAIRPQKFGDLKKLVQLGLRYDPHNAALIDLTPKVEEAAIGDAAAVEKQIEERQWPGNHKDFAGPGTPEELTKAALDHFNATCQPSEKALTACIVEPEWYCFKRNIFGQPVQWALTFWVAVDVEGETNADRVYAWSISFITEEKVDVAKAPPFKWAAFNFKKKMKRANVPGLK